MIINYQTYLKPLLLIMVLGFPNGKTLRNILKLKLALLIIIHLAKEAQMKTAINYYVFFYLKAAILTNMMMIIL